MHSVCPQILRKLLFWNTLGRSAYSQKHSATMVYAKFGGQTECIMGNWKIENENVKSEIARMWHTATLHVVPMVVGLWGGVAKNLDKLGTRTSIHCSKNVLCCEQQGQGVTTLTNAVWALLDLNVSRPGNLDHPPEFLGYLPGNF